MNFTIISKSIFKKLLAFFIIFSLSGCGIYKPVDARKVSPNDEERIKKNVKEGKSFSAGKLFNGGGGGTFQFSSSNECGEQL